MKTGVHPSNVVVTFPTNGHLVKHYDHFLLDSMLLQPVVL